MMRWLKRLLGIPIQDAPVTNQSLGVFFIYPEVRIDVLPKVERDGPQRCPDGVVQVVRDEIAERKAQYKLWKENNSLVFRTLRAA